MFKCKVRGFAFTNIFQARTNTKSLYTCAVRISDSRREENDCDNMRSFIPSPDNNMINIWKHFAVSEIFSCRNIALDYNQVCLFETQSFPSWPVKYNSE